MAGLRKKHRIRLIVAGLVLLGTSAGVVGFAMRDGIEFFRSPSQVMAEAPVPGERFRLGGLVEEGSLQRGAGETIVFNVTDGGAVVEVRYTGIVPDLFDEGQGVVAMGSLENGVFVAREILAKHDETYMPREVIDALKEQGVYEGN